MPCGSRASSAVANTRAHPGTRSTDWYLDSIESSLVTPVAHILMSSMSARRRSVAASVGDLLPRIAGGKLPGLPLPVRFWDGSVLPAAAGSRRRTPTSCRRRFGRACGAVVTVSRRAVAHVLHTPGQLGLARAWVDGSLGVEGDLEAVLAARHEFEACRFSP